MKKLSTLLLASTFCLALASIVIAGQLATSNNTVLVSSLPSPSDSEQVLTPPEKPTSETTPPATPPAATPLSLEAVINWISKTWKVLASGAGIGAAIGSLITLYVKHLLEERKLRIVHQQRIVERQTESYHEYVMNYYMPVLTSLGNFLQRLGGMIRGEKEMEGENAYELSFYFFARYWSTSSTIKKKMKVLFLTERIVEDILATLEIKIIAQLADYFRRENLSIIESVIDPDEVFTDFKAKLSRPFFRLAIAFERYCSWIDVIKNDPSFLELLTCYHRLFYFEVNKGYKAWYRESPRKLERKDLDVIKREVLNKLKRGKRITKSDEKKFLKNFQK